MELQVLSAPPELGAESPRFTPWGRSAWGEGEALLARDGLSGLPVAWQTFSKVPATAWHRFRLLALALSGPIHPALARALDCGREARSTWVAEEWIPQTHPLGAWAANDPLTPPRLRELLIHCAAVLARLHGTGIVHGGLSPRTIRIAGNRGRLHHAWITGCGFWLLGDARSRARSARFIAPEVAAGGEPTVQSDLYGLGQSLRVAAPGSSRTPPRSWSAPRAATRRRSRCEDRAGVARARSCACSPRWRGSRTTSSWRSICARERLRIRKPP